MCVPPSPSECGAHAKSITEINPIIKVTIIKYNLFKRFISLLYHEIFHLYI